MFTGIIEEIGTIKEISKASSGALLNIACEAILEDAKIGDSIAIDGTCQTIINLDNKSFSVQVSPETLSVTNFSNFKKGKPVNLERALTLSSRLGGHLVSGHIDGIAKIKSIQKQSEFYNIDVEVEQNLSKYIINKGSVTLNGVSLTVAEINSNEFSVAMIPHTFENTDFKVLKAGDFVNTEVDILAKYIEKFLSRGNNTNYNKTLDEKFLKENGFF